MNCLHLLTSDDSHVISSLIWFLKQGQNLKMLFAAKPKLFQAALNKNNPANFDQNKIQNKIQLSAVVTGTIQIIIMQRINSFLSKEPFVVC